MSSKDGKKEGKILTIGRSMGVIIPKAIRTELGLELGTPVSMEVEDGAMLLRRMEEPEAEQNFNASMERLREIAHRSGIPASIRSELLATMLELDQNGKK